MRKWFADRLDKFAYWLERRSQDVSDWAYRIRPRSPSGPLSDLILTTLRNQSHKLADSVTRNNALLQRLREGEK